jgi:hypothetical protein
MNNFRGALAYKLLILITTGGCLVQSYRLHSYKLPRDSSDSCLHNCACTLLKGGLKCRIVSERNDGLLVGAIYLTQTELKDIEIRNLWPSSISVSQWQGTVKITYDSNLSKTEHRFINSDDSEYHCGPFVVVGDQELIRKIAEILGSNEFVVSGR